MRLTVTLVLGALLTLPFTLRSAAAQSFSFVAFGDMPYCQPGAPQDCPVEEGRVARLVGEINRARPRFSIFVGDTKGGAEICSEERILRAFSWMSLADHPLHYTPGDNEWTDCWQDRAGRFDPLERLTLLRTRFFADERTLGRRSHEVQWQGRIQPQHAQFVENGRWREEGVLFATLHVVGSNNNRPTEPDEMPPSRPPLGAIEEFQARNAANIAWLRGAFAAARQENLRAVVLAIQADIFYVQRCGRGQDSGFQAFREALADAAAEFGRPVLVIHGDFHFWLHDQPIAAAPNLTRIMVPGERDTRAVRVEVDPEAAEPWRFSLLGPEERVVRARC